MASGQLAVSLGRSSEQEQEARNIRRLQVMISMVMSVISQDPSLTIEEASAMAANAKRAALAMFPDKELAFDLIYKPRLKRLIRDRFRAWTTRAIAPFLKASTRSAWAQRSLRKRNRSRRLRSR